MSHSALGLHATEFKCDLQQRNRNTGLAVEKDAYRCTYRQKTCMHKNTELLKQRMSSPLLHYQGLWSTSVRRWSVINHLRNFVEPEVNQSYPFTLFTLSKALATEKNDLLWCHVHTCKCRLFSHIFVMLPILPTSKQSRPSRFLDSSEHELCDKLLGKWAKLENWNVIWA